MRWTRFYAIMGLGSPIQEEMRTMAKRSRRARQRARRQPEQTPSGGESAGKDLAEEYAYVLSDLRRIAIIAVSMLVVLVALSYIIR